MENSHFGIKDFNLKTSKLNYLVIENSELTLENNILFYMGTYSKTDWDYGIQFWGYKC